MANKHKKKRNKVYTGIDAAVTRPILTKISAVNRNAARQWWFDHKRIARPVIIAALIAMGIIVLIVELVRIASNG